MSKRVLGILAAVEGLIILGLAGALFATGGPIGRIAMGAGRFGFGPMLRPMMGGWMHGFGIFPMVLHWVVGLIPILLVAVIVALILRPRSAEPPSN